MTVTTVAELTSPVGIIAGNGSFPAACIAEVKRRGLECVVVAHRGETDPAAVANATVVQWVRVGELGKILKFFVRHGVRQATFIGGIRRVRLNEFVPLARRFFRGVERPLALDWRAVRVLSRAKSKRDDGILRAITCEFEESGIAIFSATVLLQSWVATPGIMVNSGGLTPEIIVDLLLGWDVALVLGAHDVGQTVVVASGVVIALEGIDGTDATITRAGDLTHRRGGGVVVKLTKPNQDLRLDLPVIGVETIRRMSEARLSTLLIKAGGTLICNPQEVCAAAKDAGITVIAVSSRDEIGV